MNYRQLKEYIDGLDDEQLMDDVSIAVIDSIGVEVVAACDFVNPKTTDTNDTGYCDAVYLNEVDDSILDKGHAYITTIVG
jgi:hypothetical protein